MTLKNKTRVEEGDDNSQSLKYYEELVHAQGVLLYISIKSIIDNSIMKSPTQISRYVLFNSKCEEYEAGSTWMSQIDSCTYTNHNQPINR